MRQIRFVWQTFVLLNFFSIHPVHERFIVNLWRFIDDVFGGWDGTLRQFRSFVNCFNDYGKTFGIMFDKEQFDDTVNFLDVSVSNCTGALTTDLYQKPTDAHRYLHHNSFHPKHTFSGIPFAQMRRAVLICSNDYLRDIAISDMISYFLKCGYNDELLLQAKNRALALNRDELFGQNINLEKNSQITNNSSGSTPLCFVYLFMQILQKINISLGH